MQKDNLLYRSPSSPVIRSRWNTFSCSLSKHGLEWPPQDGHGAMYACWRKLRCGNSDLREAIMYEHGSVIMNNTLRCQIVFMAYKGWKIRILDDDRLTTPGYRRLKGRPYLPTALDTCKSCLNMLSRYYILYSSAIAWTESTRSYRKDLLTCNEFWFGGKGWPKTEGGV